MPAAFDRLKAWARAVRRDVHALWLAARDPRTPWAARLLALAIAAYALSPIDLIPDVIPVLGLLDEAILLPLAILLAIRLIPAPLLTEFRAAAALAAARPGSRAGTAIVVLVWLAAAGLLLWWASPRPADQSATTRSISTSAPTASAVTPTQVRAGSPPGGKLASHTAFIAG